MNKNDLRKTEYAADPRKARRSGQASRASYDGRTQADPRASRSADRVARTSGRGTSGRGTSGRGTSRQPNLPSTRVDRRIPNRTDTSAARTRVTRAAARRTASRRSVLMLSIAFVILAVAISVFTAAKRSAPLSGDPENSSAANAVATPADDAKTEPGVDTSGTDVSDTDVSTGSSTDTPTTEPPPYDRSPIVKQSVHSARLPAENSATVKLSTQLSSEYAILIDATTGTIKAQKNAYTKMYPASLTKIMTLIVAYEKCTDFYATFKMTNTLIDPLYLSGASLAGFAAGEEVTIKDLFYGTALPSGAEAAVGLATALYGSEEAFVAAMNAKAKSMGLTSTHFVNCTGMHDKNQYSTVRDMAVITEYALRYDFLKKVLSTYKYTTASTEQHPNGLALESTIFGRIYGDEADDATIFAGKTGYTSQAKQCLATAALSDIDGHTYICVTGSASTRWEPINDCVLLYSKYTSSQ